MLLKFSIICNCNLQQNNNKNYDDNNNNKYELIKSITNISTNIKQRIYIAF